MTAQELDWQGHRGCRGIMPENTIVAFIEALDYPVTTLELDVVITKDLKVLVSHEPWISSKICVVNGKEFVNGSTPKYNIFQMGYEEIMEFDCGVKPNPEFPYQKKIKTHKPLLSNVFKAVESNLKTTGRAPVNYNIEIKSDPAWDNTLHPEIDEFTDLVINKIDEHISRDRYNIQSFDFRVLEYCHKKYPEIKLAMLVEGGNIDKQFKDLSFKPDIYSPDYKKLSTKEVAICHDMGIKVIPWTVNTIGSIKKMIRIGVDGIITDYPNLIAEIQ
jgi:glycerophosphoryl diester phosphodiesterase